MNQTEEGEKILTSIAYAMGAGAGKGGQGGGFSAIVPLILMTLRYAITEKFTTHRRFARWTLPLWLYVSITGVIV